MDEDLTESLYSIFQYRLFNSIQYCCSICMKTWQKVYIPYFNTDYLIQYNIAVVYVKKFF